MPLNKVQKEKLKKLGAKVKEVRNSKNLTLKDLSYKIGKDPQSIHRLEVGGINPTYLYLQEVCKGLEIELTDLISDL
jgi:transcriptional regulator with XRE-family HTH domain